MPHFRVASVPYKPSKIAISIDRMVHWKRNTRPHNNGRKRPALCSRKNIRLCCLPEQYPNRSYSFSLSLICLPPHKSLLQEIKHSNKGCRFYPLPITSILFTFASLRHSRSHRGRSLNRIRVIGIAASMRHTG